MKGIMIKTYKIHNNNNNNSNIKIKIYSYKSFLNIHIYKIFIKKQ